MKKFLLTILLIVSVLQLNGQSNTDSLFNAAILKAQAGEYSSAIEEASMVLEILPERYDIMVFIANVNAWDGNYTEALVYIEKANAINSTNKELYDSWLNILLWSDQHQALIKTVNIAEEKDYPDKYNTTLKKTLAYKSLNEYDNGIETIENFAAYPDSTTLKKLYDELQMLKRQKAVSIYYSVDLFDKNTIKPQHLSYIEYMFKRDVNTFVPRFNYASRFDKNDFQLELDYYRTLKNHHYFYSNYGIGFNNGLFPQHRAGFEYYIPLENSIQVSAGARYLYNSGNGTFMLTGHISKSISKLWFSFRPYYVFSKPKNSISLTFSAKLKGETPIHFWGAELSYGNSPDERYTILQTSEIFTLKNYRFKIEKNMPIFKFSEIKFAASYNYEEYIADNFRNRYVLEVLLKHKF